MNQSGLAEHLPSTHVSTSDGTDIPATAEPSATTEVNLRHSEAGMATAEYALGTVAASTLAGVLIWVVKQGWIQEGIEAIFRGIFAA